MISFVVVIFYMLTIIGTFILKKTGSWKLPYKAFGYPVPSCALYYILARPFAFSSRFLEPSLLLMRVSPLCCWAVPLYFIAISSRKEPELPIFAVWKTSRNYLTHLPNWKWVLLAMWCWIHICGAALNAFLRKLPCLLFHYKKDYRIGGAGNVALNAQSLGARDFRVLSVIGKDEDGDKLDQMFIANNINTDYIDPERERITTNKTRIISRNQQMMRLDAEITNDLSGSGYTPICWTEQRHLSQRKSPTWSFLRTTIKGYSRKRLSRMWSACVRNPV